MLKFDWGGEGDTVYFIASFESLQKVLQQAEISENSGQSGFLIQQYVPNHNKTLRIVIIGKQLITYWRVQENPKCYLANLSKGAILDFESDPDLQSEATLSVKKFCEKSAINLAGVDVIFSSEQNVATPLLLEINYYFGRKGLGGSERYRGVARAVAGGHIGEPHRVLARLGDVRPEENPLGSLLRVAVVQVAVAHEWFGPA